MMEKQALSTRTLLACGAVAGPMYVMVTLAQALTRDGFDLRQHRFSWLTGGDLGWIHQANMLLVGVLTLLLAVGVRQRMRTGWAWFYGTALAAVFAALTAGGLIIGGNPVALAFLATPWVWVTALAVHLRQEEPRHEHRHHRV